MRFIIGFFMVAFFCPVLAFCQNSVIEEDKTVVIEARINGLVCDFCAQALQKVFSREPKVQAIKVDLTTKILTLRLKPDEDMDDQTLKNLVKKAGYTVEKISRKTRRS